MEGAVWVGHGADCYLTISIGSIKRFRRQFALILVPIGSINTLPTLPMKPYTVLFDPYAPTWHNFHPCLRKCTRHLGHNGGVITGATDDSGSGIRSHPWSLSMTQAGRGLRHGHRHLV